VSLTTPLKLLRRCRTIASLCIKNAYVTQNMNASQTAPRSAVVYCNVISNENRSFTIRLTVSLDWCHPLIFGTKHAIG
jgi:hypothetical protein